MSATIFAPMELRGTPTAVSDRSRLEQARAAAFHVGAVVLLLAVLGFAFLGSRGIWEPDEGRYSAVALNMLSSGDFLTPRIDPDHPHYAKPPLTYWAIAASIATFGRAEWAVRLPSALAYILTGLVVAMLGSALGLRRPTLAAAIWGTTLLPFVAASIATPDILLTLFESLAVLGYLSWSGTESRRGLWLMWMAFGVAFMTKGPPALLPLLAILLFESLRPRKSSVRGLFSAAPLLVFACIAGWWFVAVAMRDPSLWRYFLVYETFDRIASDVHDRNPGWIGLVKAYGPAMLAGTLPFAPLLVWSLLRRKRPAAGRKKFLYLWMAVPFAVFAVAQSRLPMYLLPLTVPLALATAWHLEEAGLSSNLIRGIAMSSAVALLGLRFASAEWPTERDTRALAQELGSVASPAQFDRILFVGARRPAYGLEFYTGKVVQAVQAGTDEPDCGGLNRGAAPLFLVPASKSDSFLREAARCRGGWVKYLGRVQHYALLGIDPQRSMNLADLSNGGE